MKHSTWLGRKLDEKVTVHMYTALCVVGYSMLFGMSLIQFTQTLKSSNPSPEKVVADFVKLCKEETSGKPETIARVKRLANSVGSSIVRAKYEDGSIHGR